MLKMHVRGRFLLFLMGVLSLGAMVGLALVFRHATRYRFAMGVYAMDETPEKKPPFRMGFVSIQSNQTLPVDKPLVARVERGTAGSTALQSVAYVLGTEGRILYQSSKLLIKQVKQRSWFGFERWVTIEEAALPALQDLPFSREYQVVIARLPDMSLQGKLLRETQEESSLESRVARMRLLAERRWGGRVESQRIFVRK